MSYIKINGITFDADVAISKYTRYFNVLDGENAGRVMTGRMVRDVIGSYLGHKYYLDPEDSKTYLCKRLNETGTIVLHYLPHELVGQYFEEA